MRYGAECHAFTLCTNSYGITLCNMTIKSLWRVKPYSRYGSFVNPLSTLDLRHKWSVMLSLMLYTASPMAIARVNLGYISVTWWCHALKPLSTLVDFVSGIQRLPMNFPLKRSVTHALKFSFVLAWTNIWINHWVFGELIRFYVHCNVTVIK